MKTVIIDVDLGLDISELLSSDAEILTGQSRIELDKAIASSKAIAKLKQTKLLEKSKSTTAINDCLEQAFELLSKAGDNGVLVSEIMGIVNPHITTPSAFMLRIKTHLKSCGNPFIIERIKLNNEFRYVFIPYNARKIDTI